MRLSEFLTVETVLNEMYLVCQLRPVIFFMPFFFLIDCILFQVSEKANVDL